MNLTHDGLSLWYGTRDAPAPEREVRSGEPVRLVVGVKPVNAANFVDVQYRIDAGPLRIAPATELRTDERHDTQYFETKLPVPPGTMRVDYCPIAHSGSIRVPRAGAERTAYSSFVVHEEPAPRVNEVGATEAVKPRFDPGLTFIAQVTVPLKPPVIIGKTPIGFRIDYYALPGTVRGDMVTATVMENSADYMIVRPDGIGLINVNATLLTDDGATITSAYTGTIDFGEDGYERMVSGDYPKLPPLQINPRLMTEHPRYQWVNRTHFLGVGNVDMEALVLRYDVYTVKTLAASKTEHRP